MLENLFWLGLVGAAIALTFALVQAKKVLAFSEGTELMQKLAASIRKGANAYLCLLYTSHIAGAAFDMELKLMLMHGGHLISPS